MSKFDPVSVGTDILTGFTNSLFQDWNNSKMTKRQVKAQKELNEHQTKLAYDTWSKQVQNQALFNKQGLRNAGMSLANMENSQVGFGSAAQTGGSVSGSSPVGSFVDFNNARLLQSQIDLNKSQEHKNEADTNKITVEINGIQQDIEIRGNLAPWQQKQMQAEILKATQEVAESERRMEKLCAETKLTEQQLQQNEKSFEPIMKKLVAEAELTQGQVELLKYQALVMAAQANNLNSGAAYNKALTDTEDKLRKDKFALLHYQAFDQDQTSKLTALELRDKRDMYNFLRMNNMTTGGLMARQLMVELANGKVSEKEALQRVEEIKEKVKYLEYENDWYGINHIHSK